MKLSTNNFRRLNSDLEPLNIREMKTSPIIVIGKDGRAGFASTPKQKDELLVNKGFGPSNAIVLFAWAGKYRTDVFLLSEEDLIKHYSNEN